MKTIFISIGLFICGLIVTVAMGLVIPSWIGYNPYYSNIGMNTMLLISGCIANLVLALPILIFCKSKYKRVYFYCSISGLYIVIFMALIGRLK